MAVALPSGSTATTGPTCMSVNDSTFVAADQFVPSNVAARMLMTEPLDCIIQEAAAFPPAMLTEMAPGPDTTPCVLLSSAVIALQVAVELTYRFANADCAVPSLCTQPTIAFPALSTARSTAPTG